MPTNHVPLKYATGLIALREHRHMHDIIVNAGDMIDEETINSCPTDPGKFIIVVRSQPGIAAVIKGNIKDHEQRHVSKLSSMASVIKPGTVIFKEGDESFDIHVLLKGSVRVSKDGTTIADIAEPGTFIGEMASIRQQTRSATVTTMSDCTFYTFDGKSVLSAAKDNPVILSRMCKSLAEKLARIDSHYAKAAPYLDMHDLENQQQDTGEQRAAKKTIISYSEGEILFEQGETSMDIYILMAGEARVVIDGKQVAKITQTGAIIGEMSGLLCQPRNATIKIVKKSRFCKIPACDLLIFAATQPKILFKMCLLLADRLAATNAEFLKHQ